MENERILNYKKGNLYASIVNGNALRVFIDSKNAMDLIELNEETIEDVHENVTEIQLSGYVVEFLCDRIVVKKNNVVVTSIEFDENGTIFSIENNYKVFGLGDKMAYLDKKGYAYRSWNTDDPSHQDEQYKALYKSVNYLLVKSGNDFFSVFFPSTYPYDFDLGKANEKEIRVVNEHVSQDFYLFLGEDIRQITSDYSKLVGHPYFIRYKMLGYNQSRWTYKTQEEVYDLVNEFEKHDMPLDYIHLDIDYMNGFRNGTINKTAYPDFAKMSDDIAKKGVGLVVINDAGDKVDDGFETYRYMTEHNLVARKDGKAYVNVVWPGDSVFPNYFDAELKEYKNRVMSRFVDENHIDGIWNDMNEPASFNGELPLDVDFSYGNRKLDNLEGHNVYGEHMAKTLAGVYERKNRRPYIFSRAGFATTSKYAFFWNGDNASLWHHLKLSIPQILSMGLSNMMFNGVDVGGFNCDTTKQLLSRWIEAGVLYPFLRNHSSIDTTRQEPFAFDEQTTAIYRKMLKIRYSFAPYLYDLAYRMSSKGELFNAPLFYFYPSDIEAYKYNDEYMVGESVLVAPITDKDADKRVVYLPEGVWKDYLSGIEYEGNKAYLVDMPIDCVGLYIKKNSIIPMTKAENHMIKSLSDTLILSIYGDEAHAEIYDDDGDSLNYQKEEYNVYSVDYKNGKVAFATNHKQYDTAYKTIVLRNVSNGKEVSMPFAYDFVAEL